MDLNKYYTPEIDEFHVGFEFEFSEDNNEIWRKFNLPRLINLCSLNSFLFKNDFKVRVKYLDKEDIESFGFKLKSKSIDLWFEREEIYLRDDGYHLDNIKLQYGLHDQKLKITFHYVGNEEQIHFEGIIKNKSELKKLMKQLGIL